MRMIEHLFVTGMRWEEARATLKHFFIQLDLRLACTCLGCGGGDDPPRLDLLDAHCPRCQQPRKITFSNGVISAKRRAPPKDQPLWLSLEFNRGRIEMAAAIERWGRSSEDEDVVLDYFARSLEGVFDGSLSIDEAIREWKTVE